MIAHYRCDFYVANSENPVSIDSNQVYYDLINTVNKTENLNLSLDWDSSLFAQLQSVLPSVVTRIVVYNTMQENEVIVDINGPWYLMSNAVSMSPTSIDINISYSKQSPNQETYE